MERHPLGTKENFELLQWLLDPKIIDGALRSAIHAHGFISTGSRKVFLLEEGVDGFWVISESTTCSTSSAAKRIRGAMKTRAAEYLSKKSLAQTNKSWYNRFRDKLGL